MTENPNVAWLLDMHPAEIRRIVPLDGPQRCQWCFQKLTERPAAYTFTNRENGTTAYGCHDHALSIALDVKRRSKKPLYAIPRGPAWNR